MQEAVRDGEQSRETSGCAEYTIIVVIMFIICLIIVSSSIITIIM